MPKWAMVKGLALSGTSTSHLRHIDKITGTGSKARSWAFRSGTRHSSGYLHKTYTQTRAVNTVSQVLTALPPECHGEVNGCWRRKSHFFNDVATYRRLVSLYITYPTLRQDIQIQWVMHRKTREQGEAWWKEKGFRRRGRGMGKRPVG